MSDSPFTYKLRESPRAKNVRLRVTPQHGLEVVVPAGYNPRRIPLLLERKRTWIGAALERAEAARKFFAPCSPWRLPTQIHLAAIGKTFHVDAREIEAPSVSVWAVAPEVIEVRGRLDDERACRAALARWLAREARRQLVPRLETLSSRTGLKYRRVFVKQQRTRWASCSRRQNISLNLRLLFLQPALVDYVIIHELSHLAEMSHSRKFWLIVEENCPEYRRLDSRLREMWKAVPLWAAPFDRGATLD